MLFVALGLPLGILVAAVTITVCNVLLMLFLALLLTRATYNILFK
jgi:hypothetical protein